MYKYLCYLFSKQKNYIFPANFRLLIIAEVSPLVVSADEGIHLQDDEESLHAQGFAE